MKDYDNLTHEQAILELKRLSKRYLNCSLYEEDIIRRCQENMPMPIKQAELDVGINGQNHLLIEGDNYASLMWLLTTHTKKINIIYIDPPYNTGNNDFIYNDRYIDKENKWRHSTWHGFMENRLLLAKYLLSDDGIIFISIDDNEQARLKLICDDIFGEENFISTITWYKGYGKNDTQHIRNVCEYILVYAKDKNKCIKLNSVKAGYDDVMKLRQEFIDTNNKDGKKLQKIIKEYYKNNTHLKGITSYNNVESETLRIYRGVTMEDPKGSNYNYDVIHPNGKICKRPKKGWNRPEHSMNELVANNEIIFGVDETVLPQRKYYLDEMKDEVPKNIINNSDQGGAEIRRMNIDFSFPKPVSLIKEIIGWIDDKNATILDFFAGSGTTAQAVIELNKEDGGNRQCILMTNNENKICENITYPRVKKVIEGYTRDNGEKVEGYEARLHYFKTGFEQSPKDDIELASMLSRHDGYCGLVSIKESAYDIIAEKHDQYDAGYKIYNGDNKVVVLLDTTTKFIADLEQELNKLLPTIRKIIYLRDMDDDNWGDTAEKLNSIKNIEFRSTLQDIIDNYRLAQQTAKIDL